LRPLKLADEVSLRLEAADLRPHPAGTQLDIVASARVGTDEVWTSRSTYLHRGAKPSSRSSPRSSTSANSRERPSGAATMIRVPDDIGRRYAAIAGDRNPIHLYAITAKAFGFPRAIAHGMWVKARVLATLEGRLSPAYTVDATFKSPVLLPSTIELITEHRGPNWRLEVRDPKSDKPQLAATLRPV